MAIVIASLRRFLLLGNWKVQCLYHKSRNEENLFTTANGMVPSTNCRYAT